MDEAPWGGSEELWARMAEVALEDGHQVWTLTTSWPETPQTLQRLKERGAKVAFKELPAALTNKSSRRYLRLLDFIKRSDRDSSTAPSRWRCTAPASGRSSTGMPRSSG